MKTWGFFSLCVSDFECRWQGIQCRGKDTGFRDSAPTLSAPSHNAHQALCSVSLAALFKRPGFCFTPAFRGFRFSFVLWEDEAWGARALFLCFSGHLWLLALCPKDLQFQHLTCEERRRSVSQPKPGTHVKGNRRTDLRRWNVGCRD